MAHTKVTKNGTQNTGTANTFSYSGSFNVFKASEVEVELDNVALTFTTSTINESASPREYTVDYDNKTVHVGGADLASSNSVVIQPVTDMGAPTPRATYAPGSSVTSEDLNNNQLQLMRKAMEYDEQKLSSRGGTMTGNLHLAKDIDITFEGDTDNAYETTITVADPTSDKTITFPDTTGTVVTTGDTATVTATMLAANSVDSSELVDGSIDTSHIADSQVTAAKLGSSAVTTVKLATDAVTTAKITDANVTTAKIADDAVTADKLANTSVTAGSYTATDLTVDAQGRITAASNGTIAGSEIAADAIDGTKIADDSINSEHYVDGSIDTAHIADSTGTTDGITTAKLADQSVTTAKLANAAAGTDQIAHSAIATVKLASNAVTTSKITDGNVTTDKLAADSVTIAKIGCEQTTISDSDSHIPTSGAVVDYVAAQIAPIGGLEVIATDAAFPNTQPDSGVVISIADAGGLVVNGSGTSTTGRTVGGSTVTINNIASNFNSLTVDAGVCFQVSSTGSGQVYNYHKATLKEADLLNLSNDINDFGNRYRVFAGEPSSNNDEGDLVYDTNANKMKVYDSSTSAWKEVTSTGDFKYLFLCPAGGSGAPTLNGSIATYDLRESSNSGSAASVTNAAQLIVSVNGVIQKANTGTSAPAEGFALVDANTIIFSANLASGDSVFIVQIGSAVTIPTPGDGTVSAAKIASGAVETAKIADDAVNADKLASNSVVSASIVDGSIVNADVNASAAIAGSKISPDFGSQNISSGSITTVGAININSNDPTIHFNEGDGNPDYKVMANAGVLKFIDATADTSRIIINTDGHVDVTGNLDVGAGVDVTGNITCTGTIPAAQLTGTLPAISGANLTDLPASGKATNAIINGDMKVSQRGTSETGIDGANEGYRVAPDRWKVEGATFGTHTVSQSTESPNGFGNSYKVDCTTANTSLSAGSFFDLIQKIEGQDLQNFAKGTSDAKQFALSFYVKTNKTGTYVVMLLDHDNDRLVSKTYTVSNTNWNRYTLIFPADTTGGFDNDNNASLSIKFILVAGTTFTSGSLQTTWGAASNGVSRVGQVNFADSTSNEWHLTGVQLEAGDSASDFAHESYAETLAKCQRYFQVLVHRKSGDGGVYFGGGYMYDHYRAYLPITYYVEMRSAPSFQHTNGSSYYSLHRQGVGDNFDGWNTVIGGDNKHAALQAQSGLSGTGGTMGGFWSNAEGAKITFESEL